MKSLFDLEEQQRLWLDRIFKALASETRLLLIRTLRQLNKPVTLRQLKAESNLQHFSWKLFLSHVQVLVDARLVKLTEKTKGRETMIELTFLGENFVKRLEEIVEQALLGTVSS